MNRDQFFSYFWPVLAGLLIGLLIFTRMSPETAETQGFNSAGQISSLSTGNWNGPVSYSPAVTRAAPSVVNIYTSKTVQQPVNPLFNDPIFRRYFNSALFGTVPEQQNSLGSGVIISRDGYILTNQHVINDADQILVQLRDGRQSTAEVVGFDAETDLAVLKVPLDNLPVIALGDPTAADVGDVVLAIGNPFGVGQTVTQGIISATGRNLSDYVNFIQTDAAINQGNSGGALIDVFGNLIGINTAIIENAGAVGVGFATPSDIAIKVVKDIVEYGHVVRGWTGISAFELPPEAARSLGVSNTRAPLMVSALTPGGPALRAGMQIEDILTGINGRPITGVGQVLRLIADTPPGDNLVFDVMRDGEQLQITVQADIKPENG